MDLSTLIEKLQSIGPVFRRRLKRLEIKTVGDLLYHFPSRYEDYSAFTTVNALANNQIVSLRAQVFKVENFRTKTGKTVTKAVLVDQTGVIEAVWFNQPYLKGKLEKSGNWIFSGKTTFFQNKLVLSNPQFEPLENDDHLHTGRLVPIYPETASLSSKWLRGKIASVLPLCKDQLTETLDNQIIKRQNLLDIARAIEKIHFPNDQKDIDQAKKRLAFDELFQIQINSIKKRLEWQQKRASAKMKIKNSKLAQFLSSLPFRLTDAQKKCVKEIIFDLQKEIPMNRLLEGDVGSGKTIVAACGAFVVKENNFKTLIMAPTEILAFQHYQTISQLFKPWGIGVGLITKSQKTQIGDVTIGTHALLNLKTVLLDQVGLVVIDEQHRFGVEQRAKLNQMAAQKRLFPHFLTMTATPIPRTIALTLYGNLDLSVLDQMPKGRKIVETFIVPQKKRQDAYEFIKKHLQQGEQAIIICPLIEPSESLVTIKAAKVEFQKLKEEVFQDFTIALLHGKLKSEEKGKIMESFSQNQTKILVATPVVEVGIDVPNATIIVIEGAERFGLAQLHQLRGRVGRSQKQSYCLLFSESQSSLAFKRLSALKRESIGLRLAEIDLKLRGPGEIFGVKQHGFPEFKVADFSNLLLIETTNQEAKRLLNVDPTLKNHSALRKAIEERFKSQAQPN